MIVWVFNHTHSLPLPAQWHRNPTPDFVAQNTNLALPPACRLFSQRGGMPAFLIMSPDTRCWTEFWARVARRWGCLLPSGSHWDRGSILGHKATGSSEAPITSSGSWDSGSTSRRPGSHCPPPPPAQFLRWEYNSDKAHHCPYTTSQSQSSGSEIFLEEEAGYKTAPASSQRNWLCLTEHGQVRIMMHSETGDCGEK